VTAVNVHFQQRQRLEHRLTDVTPNFRIDRVDFSHVFAQTRHVVDGQRTQFASVLDFVMEIGDVLS
jgi:hypothetical protein